MRRTNRVLPEPRPATGSRRQAASLNEDEVITTARSSQRRRPASARTTAPVASAEPRASSEADDTSGRTNGNGTGVVRQWMSELASGARPVAQGGGTVRAPSETEIAILTGMFPDIDREVVLGVLQRR